MTSVKVPSWDNFWPKKGLDETFGTVLIISTWKYEHGIKEINIVVRTVILRFTLNLKYCTVYGRIYWF